MQRAELKEIMLDSGMRYVTNAEVGFMFNVIGRTSPTGINLQTFTNWGKSMERST